MKKNRELATILTILFLGACMVTGCSNLSDEPAELIISTSQAPENVSIDKPASHQLEITRNCIRTVTGGLEHNKLDAQLVFRDRENQRYMVFSLGAKTLGELYNVLHFSRDWTALYLSPNHNEYMYYLKDTGWYLSPVRTSNRYYPGWLPDFDEDFLFFYWQHEDFLLLEHYFDEPEQALHLLSLRTGEYEKILLDLPDPLFMENQYHGENEFGKYRFSIDTNPQITRALFYSSDKTKKIYWDIERKKTLAVFPVNPDNYDPDMGFGISSPSGQFSPDGEDYYVLLGVGDQTSIHGEPEAVEVFRVDRDGNINQLTNFSDFYSSVKIRMRPIFKDNLYLPIWVDLKGKKYFAENEIEEEIPKLILLNTRTGELRGICFVEDYHFAENSVAGQIIYPAVDWIVYGDYFLIPLYVTENREDYPVWHIVNLITNEVYSLDFPDLPNLQYVGWLYER